MSDTLQPEFNHEAYLTNWETALEAYKTDENIDSWVVRGSFPTLISQLRTYPDFGKYFGMLVEALEAKPLRPYPYDYAVRHLQQKGDFLLRNGSSESQEEGSNWLLLGSEIYAAEEDPENLHIWENLEVFASLGYKVRIKEM